MEHLMSYGSTKGKAWSHRAMLALGVVVLAFSTVAVASSKASSKYDLTYTVDSIQGSLMFDVTVTEHATGKVVAQPRLRTQPGILAMTRSGTATATGQGREVKVSVLGKRDGSGQVTLEVPEGNAQLQYTASDYAPGTARRKYSGDPIDMKLKDADLHDVLRSFAQITGLTFDVAPDVQGSLTIELVNVPWDKVLDDILNEHGLVGEVDGKTIHVRKKR